MWLPLHTQVQYLHSGYYCLSNSMYFKLLLCVPQGVPVANKYQMGLSVNILYQMS